MNYSTVVKELIKEISELKPFYDKALECRLIEGPEQHYIFGNVLNPYLINLLEINEDKELINRIFDFLEKMVTCDDFQVQRVVKVTVIEGLAYDETILIKSQKYMGKETRKMSDEVGFMNFETVDKGLIKEIPEIKPIYDRAAELLWRNEPDAFTVFEDVLNPYLINLLATNGDEELISRIFVFLEKMANYDDFLVQYVVESTVLERLAYFETILTKAQKYMGKETKKMSDKVALEVKDAKKIKYAQKELSKETKMMNYEVGVMNYSTVDIELIREIPEIKPFYDEELESWDEEIPGQHIIFGNVLDPYLINLLEINEDKELLGRIFDFLEKMATCSYVKVQDVLGATVLERLGDDKTILKKAQEYMGKETKKMSYEVEKGWGRI